MGDSPGKRAREAELLHEATAKLGHDDHLKDVATTACLVNLELVSQNLKAFSADEKRNYLEELIRAFSEPQDVNTLSRCFMPLSQNFLGTGGYLYCLERFLRLTEVFNTPLERLKNSTYLESVYALINQAGVIPQITQLLWTGYCLQKTDVTAAGQQLLMLKVLRLYLQGNRIPQAPENVNLNYSCKWIAACELKCCTLLDGVTVGGVYDVLVPLLQKYLADLTEFCNEDDDEQGAELKVTLFQVVAELVRCMEAAAEGMALLSQPDVAAYLQPQLVKILNGIQHVYAFVVSYNHPTMDTIVPVMSAMAVFLGHTQGDEYSSIIPLPVDFIVQILAVVNKLLEHFHKLEGGSPVYDTNFAAFATNIMMIGTHILRRQCHGQGIDNLHVMFANVDAKAHIENLFLHSLEMLDPMNRRWVLPTGKELDAKPVVLRHCLEFIVEFVTYRGDPGGGPRQEVCNYLLNGGAAAKLIPGLHSIFKGPRSYRKGLGTSPMHHDGFYSGSSVTGTAFHLLEALCGPHHGSQDLPKRVAEEFAPDLVRLMAGHDTRQGAHSVAIKCMQHTLLTGRASIDPFMDANFMDMLFLSLCSVRKHVDKLELYAQTYSGIVPFKIYDFQWEYLTDCLEKVKKIMEHGDVAAPGAAGALMAAAPHHKKAATRSEKKISALIRSNHIDNLRTMLVLVCEEIRQGRTVASDFDGHIQELTEQLRGLLQMCIDTQASEYVKRDASSLQSELTDSINSAYEHVQVAQESDMETGEGGIQVRLIPEWRRDRKDTVEPTWFRPLTLKAIKYEMESKKGWPPCTLCWRDIRNAVDVDIKDEMDLKALEASHKGTMLLEIIAKPVDREYFKVKLRAEGNMMVNEAKQLPAKQQAITDLKNLMFQSGRSINQKLIDDFYTKFAQHGQGSDSISPQTFTTILQETDKNITQEVAHALFKIFDADGSGLLSLKEAVVGMCMLMDEDEDTKIGQIFTAYDEDNSGTLEFDELMALIKVTSVGAPEDLISSNVQIVMRNSARDHTHLTKEEFIKAVKAGILNLGPLLKKADDFKAQFKKSFAGAGAGAGAGAAGSWGQRKPSPIKHHKTAAGGGGGGGAWAAGGGAYHEKPPRNGGGGGGAGREGDHYIPRKGTGGGGGGGGGAGKPGR